MFKPESTRSTSGIHESPDFCVIEVSHKCMFKCKMCYTWKGQGSHQEVNVEDFCNFVSSLKNFINGPFEMNISGGEPLLKAGTLDLVEFIARQGFRFSLVTNAYLINKLTAKRIADSGLDFLAISLDSLNERTHDYLRGINGAYRKAMQAIDYFEEYRGRLKNIIIQTIIMSPNLEEILGLASWADKKQLSLSFMAVMQPNMTPVDSAWYKNEGFSFLWPKDDSKVRYVLDNLIKLKNSGCRIDNPVGQLERFKLYFSNPERFAKEAPCSLGNKMIHVNPRGDIYLCCEMEPIGNIKESGIKDVWNSEKAQKIREKIRVCKKNCAGMVNCYREER